MKSAQRPCTTFINPRGANKAPVVRPFGIQSPPALWKEWFSCILQRLFQYCTTSILTEEASTQWKRTKQSFLPLMIWRHFGTHCEPKTFRQNPVPKRCKSSLGTNSKKSYLYNCGKDDWWSSVSSYSLDCIPLWTLIYVFHSLDFNLCFPWTCLGMPRDTISAFFLSFFKKPLKSNEKRNTTFKDA